VNGSLSKALATGYLTIAVQTVTGLILVPFLLSTHGVGLTGFAAIATLQAAAGLLAVMFDGYRQQSSRLIAIATSSGERTTLPSVIQFTLIASLAVAVPWVIAGKFTCALIGVRTHDAVAAITLTAIYFVVEQLCYALESDLHAQRKSWIPSTLGGVDTVLRAILTVLFFKAFSANVSLFFLAALIGQSLKAALLLQLSSSESRLLGRWFLSHISNQFNTFVTSLPLAFNGIAPFIVFRGSVIVANAALAGEQAGVIAIILITLRTYVNQGLFSVLRPMLIPRMALLDVADKTSASYRRLSTYLDLFQVSILLVGVIAAVSAPVWLDLWLGSSVKAYSFFIQIAVALYFLEVAYGAHYYCLLAHDNGRQLALLTGLFSLLSAGVVAFGAYYGSSLASYLVPVMTYLMLYVFSVRLMFGRNFSFSMRRSDIYFIIFVVATLSGISIAATTKAMGIFVSIGAGTLFLGLLFALGIPLDLFKYFSLQRVKPSMDNS
jgi:hypothetical protein